MTRKLMVNAPSHRGFRAWLPRSFWWPRAGFLALLLLPGCTQGGASDSPILRSIGWFNHLNGTDIREACAPGSGDRYRLVYNAVWGEQVRDYEVVVDTSGTAGAQLSAHILVPGDQSSIDLTDPLGPWRGRRSLFVLTPADVDVLVADLHESGFYGPTPSGLVLPSDGYYWIVAACENGVYHYNAWVYPSDRFAAIRFPPWLFRRDGTGVAVNPPQPRPPLRTDNRVVRENRVISIFDLKVGGDGLVGIP